MCLHLGRSRRTSEFSNVDKQTAHSRPPSLGELLREENLKDGRDAMMDLSSPENRRSRWKASGLFWPMLNLSESVLQNFAYNSSRSVKEKMIEKIPMTMATLGLIDTKIPGELTVCLDWEETGPMGKVNRKKAATVMLRTTAPVEVEVEVEVEVLIGEFF